MQHWSYLCFLLVSLLAMVVCDRRWKLAFFNRPFAALRIIVGLVALFMVWDTIGIAAGVFFRGDSPWMTGVEIFPDMPLEEPLFLFFLSYLTVNLTSAARMVFHPVKHLSPGKTGV